MRNINRIDNRNDFISYCLRKLGEPVIQVNVAHTQIEDCIDDAIKMYYDYHVDGSYKSYVIHIITQNELHDKKIRVKDDVLTVTGMISNNTNKLNLKNNIQMKAYFSDIISRSSSNGLSSYVITKSYLNTFNSMISSSNFTITEHNYHKRELSIMHEWDSLSVGDIIGYECWVANDIDEIYNDYWLQQYATAVIKKQWGQNLIKVDGMTLPGGGVLKGGDIYSNAIRDMEKLEEQLKDDYAYPVMPFLA